MTDPRIRNDPTFIVPYLIVVAAVAILSLIFIPRPWGLRLFILIPLAGTYTLVRRWSNTRLSFDPDNIIVEQNLMLKKKKIIPYGRIASINVTRSVFNRMFGTTKIRINVNSSETRKKCRTAFTFKNELADEIKRGLSESLHTMEYTSVEAEPEGEPIISLNPAEIILHCAFGISGLRFILIVSTTIYFLYCAMTDGGTGIKYSIAILVAFEAVRITLMYVKYCGFKIYRTGDIIQIRHGAIHTHRSSFNVNRINAIRFRRSFSARIIGRCVLEAEVVGINSISWKIAPILCPLIKDKKMMDAAAKFIPEFVEKIEYIRQPRNALYMHLLIASIASAAVILVMAYPCQWFLHLTYMPLRLPDWTRFVPLAGTVSTVVYLLGTACILYKVRNFGIGENLFSFVNGVFDRTTVIFQYDRAQISIISSGIVSKKLSLAKAKVSILASSGRKTIKSGYFGAAKLQKINEMIMERLSNGKYNYRINGI